MKKIVNLIKNNLKKELVPAPNSIYKLLKAAQKDNFWLRINETLKVQNDLLIHTHSAIRCKEKDIQIVFYENNKQYIINKFKILDEHTIKISKEYYNLWKIVDTHTPNVKMASVSFLTDDKFGNRELVTIDGKLFIKACLAKKTFCISTSSKPDTNYQILIDFDYYKITYTNCTLTILKDSINGNKYYLYLEDDEVKIKKV